MSKIIDRGAGYFAEIDYVFGSFRVRVYDNNRNLNSETYIPYDIASALSELLTEESGGN